MSDYYAFTVGELKCAAVRDGSYAYEAGSFFAGVPEGEFRAELERTGITTERITTPYTSLTVGTGRHRILVDTGAGTLAPTTGRLTGSLRSAGVSPEEIDIVAITHAHPDHIGGVLDRDGNLQYPNARYVMPRREWEFWFSEEVHEMLPSRFEWFIDLARSRLHPVESRMTVLEFGDEIVPGVTLLEATGHTPGHGMVAFRTGSEKLLFASDAVVLPLHLEHPDWRPEYYDIDPDRADETKRRVADMIAQEGWLALFQHFPFPSLGHIEKNGPAWRWIPAAGTGNSGETAEHSHGESDE